MGWTPMDGDNQLLVTDEPVEYEKITGRKITGVFFGNMENIPKIEKGKRKDVNMEPIDVLWKH